MRFPPRFLFVLVCAALASACATSGAPVAATSVVSTTAPRATQETTTAAPTIIVPTSTVPISTVPISTVATTASGEAGVPISIRIWLDRRVTDDATSDFGDLTEAVLTDGRGWQQAGFDFSFSETDYDYTIVLAEGNEVDRLCLPYDTRGRFSCQIGAVVALNADRWRTAVESWPASLDDYRTMLVNHEVGHLIGQHHVAVRCPGDGLPAPVMAQQSSGVAPCTANPWPLPWEIECARQGVEPLAPPYEQDIELTCGPGVPLD